MKIDFHIHSKITGGYPFCPKHFVKMINEAKSAGLDAIAIMEHLYADNFEDAYLYLKDNFPYQAGDYYLVEGLKVFVGVEVGTIPLPKLDFVCIGNRDKVLKLRQSLLPYLEGKYADINKLFQSEYINDMLVVLAHPFRKDPNPPNLPPQVLKRIDALEKNVRDTVFVDGNGFKIAALAQKFNKPVVGGSDTHHYLQTGSIATVFDGEPGQWQRCEAESTKANL